MNKHQNSIPVISQTTVSHSIVLDICRSWVSFEKVINTTSHDTIHGDPMWMNMLAVNLFSPENIDAAFDIKPDASAILSRIGQLYIQVIATVGMKYINTLNKEINKAMVSMGATHYKQYSKQMPFLVLIPFFNELYKDFKLQQ